MPYQIYIILSLVINDIKKKIIIDTTGDPKRCYKRPVDRKQIFQVQTIKKITRRPLMPCISFSSLEKKTKRKKE